MVQIHQLAGVGDYLREGITQGSQLAQQNQMALQQAQQKALLERQLKYQEAQDLASIFGQGNGNDPRGLPVGQNGPRLGMGNQQQSPMQQEDIAAYQQLGMGGQPQQDQQTGQQSGQYPSWSQLGLDDKILLTKIAPQMAKNLIDEEKLNLDREKFSFEQKKSDRTFEHEETKPERDYYEDVQKKYRASLESKPVYEALQSGAKERLPLSSMRAYLGKVSGLPPGVLFSPTEEGLDKFANQTLRGIAAYYPDQQIRVAEIENWMRSNPSLMNSEEGMERLSKIALNTGRIAEEEHKISSQLVKKNKGRPYLGLKSDVIQKMAPFVDSVSRENIRIMKGEDKILPRAEKTGQSLNAQQAKHLVNKHKGDRIKVMEEAKSLGYATE